MKIIPLQKTIKCLGLPAVEILLSKILVHQDTEETLEGLQNNAYWIEKKQIYISSVPNQKQFSNENWKYYLPVFQNLKPEILKYIPIH